MDAQKIALGALFLFLSSVISLETGIVEPRTPLVVAALASLGLAGGSLLIRAHEEERPADHRR